MAVEKDIFFVSGDFGSPVLDSIRSDYPDRFLNVGIAEQNLINVTAGLALEGYKVFAYAIAPFITMRCFEQIRVSLGLLSEVRPMNVNLIGVGAGYSYVVSGPTHQCYEDITLMRSLPNMGVYSISDEVLARSMPRLAVESVGPKYFRLDAQVLPIIYEVDIESVTDGFHYHTKGDSICLLATGYMVHTAIRVRDELIKRGLEVGVIDIFNLSTFNERRLKMVLSGYEAVVTMEEGFPGRGGLDSMIFNYLLHSNVSTKMLNIGVEGGYRFEIGEREVLHEQVGIGVNASIEKVVNFHKTL
jgi:transketolase